MTRKKGLLAAVLLISLTLMLSGCLLFGWPPTGPLGQTEEGASYYDGVYRMILSIVFTSGANGMKSRTETAQTLYMAVTHFYGNPLGGDLTYQAVFYDHYNPVSRVLSGYRGQGEMSFEVNPSYTFSICDDSGDFILDPDHEFCEVMMNGSVFTRVDEAQPGGDNTALQRRTRLSGHLLGWCGNDMVRAAGIMKSILPEPGSGEEMPTRSELIGLFAEQDERQVEEGHFEDVAFGRFLARWIAPLPEMP